MDDNMTEECLFYLYKEMNEFQLSQRGVHNHVNDELQELGHAASIDTLFSLLKSAETMDAAFWIAETIKDSWKAHCSVGYRIRLDDGIACLLQTQQREKALDIFQTLVKDDPLYGEAWNMLATCYYIRSDQRILSKEAAQNALSLLPQNFQAMSILGLIQCDEQQDELAAETFRKVLELDPWSQVSTKLAQCLKTSSKT
jgi:tetratricopeptide (TPR) repeat protein